MNIRITLLILLPLLSLAVMGLGAAAVMTADEAAIHTGRDPRVREPMPDFAASSFGAADLKGRVVVLNFFASWCAPCRLEHPVITALANRGAAVYGVDYHDDPGALKAYLARNGNPYRAVADDPDGTMSRAFGMGGVPATLIVDRRGTIRYRVEGMLTMDDLDPVVRVLGELEAEAP